MVVADGNIYCGSEHWIGTENRLAELLPRLGISPNVRDRSFPGGSIFWIRPFLLRTLAAAGLKLEDFEPEPLPVDGGLGHAVERMFGLFCEDAGMYVLEHSRIAEAIVRSSRGPSRVHIIPWGRNWDGLERDVLMTQTYQPGWVIRFVHDIAPLLRDRRYFRLNGKPMLLIYRIGHIPDAGTAVRELRVALSKAGIPDVHLAAGWVAFPDDARELPADPSVLGLDAYFEFPPHMLAPNRFEDCRLTSRRALPACYMITMRP
jgi:hypothetical protein